MNKHYLIVLAAAGLIAAHAHGSSLSSKFGFDYHSPTFYSKFDIANMSQKDLHTFKIELHRSLARTQAQIALYSEWFNAVGSGRTPTKCTLILSGANGALSKARASLYNAEKLVKDAFVDHSFDAQQELFVASGLLNRLANDHSQPHTCLTGCPKDNALTKPAQQACLNDARRA